MFVLGISAYYHDSAAAIINNGKVVAAAQEERFSRIKHDAGFPVRSVQFCLSQVKINVTQLDAVVFYEKPLIKFERMLETYLANAPYGFNSFRRAIPIWLKEKLFLKRLIRKELMGIGDCNRKQLPKLYFDQHHRAHASSAYFPSPFDNAAVICLDGVGEWATTSIWYGQRNSLKNISEIHFPDSLGLFYSAFTYYCGFKVNSGEYKLMGLAPYGQPKYTEIILDKIINLNEDGSFKLDMKYFNYHRGLTMTSKYFHELFGGSPRKSESSINQKHMDLAASVQSVIEQAILGIVKHTAKAIKSDNLCLAGGVALNCVANSKIKDDSEFKNIWIQPAAGDAGGALGAALSLWHGHFKMPKLIKDPDGMSGCFLGPKFDNEKIKNELKNLEANYQYIDNDLLYKKVAQLLASQQVVGWFQGAMEFGPRGLGARSILADPRNLQMQSTVNQKIKFRESFRPFAPAVLTDDRAKYFELDIESPYMLFTVKVRHDNDQAHDSTGFEKIKFVESKIPATTHIDYSARVQTVNQNSNSGFYKLLSEFKKLTSCGVLLNTSFNVRGEPIVCSPIDAYKCFMKSGLDYLVIGNFLLDKKDQKSS